MNIWGNILYTHNEVQFSFQKEWVSVIFNNMEGTVRYHASEIGQAQKDKFPVLSLTHGNKKAKTKTKKWKNLTS